MNYEQPIALVSGNGRHVTDADGIEYLDFFGGILTTSIGHCIDEITEAVIAQARRIVHTSTTYLIEREIELAERIAALSGIKDAKVFFTNSGSEANETALMLSTIRTRSDVVLALENSYHGRTFATLAITGNRAWRPTSLSPVQVTFVDAGSAPEFGVGLSGELFDASRRATNRLIDSVLPIDPACFLFEPIQGVGGFVIPQSGVVRAVAEEVRSHGGLVISDEVQTGWGRLGTSFFGAALHDVHPDLMTFAKGLANGLPIGGVVGPAEILDSVPSGSISTFGGNPLSTAAALATLSYIEEHDLPRHVGAVGARLKAGLQGLTREVPFVREVRGSGLMIGMECCEPGGTTPSRAAATALLEATKGAGVLVGRGGFHANVLRIAPPMSVTESEIDDALDRFATAISAASAALG